MVEILNFKKNGATVIQLNVTATNSNVWGISMFHNMRHKNAEYITFNWLNKQHLQLYVLRSFIRSFKVLPAYLPAFLGEQISSSSLLTTKQYNLGEE
jgi:hypothetical protein